jgi:hypothetical protein
VTNVDSYKIKHLANRISPSPPPQQTTVIADTGASGHYIRTNDPHTNTGINRASISVGLPNRTVLRSNKEECLLNPPQLPIAAQDANVIPGLTHSSLISIGKLCDAGCKAEFDETQVLITHKQKTILRVLRDKRTGLWRIPMVPSNLIPTETKQQHCNNTYKTQSIPKLIKFLHATAFSPTKAAWLDAIQQGCFQSWPGLTYAAANKHFPTSMDMHKGHMDQTRKNVRSTKQSVEDSEPTPTQESDNHPTNFTFATIEDTGKIYPTKPAGFQSPLAKDTNAF